MALGDFIPGGGSVFADKVGTGPSPGDTANFARASEMNAIKHALMDLRTHTEGVVSVKDHGGDLQAAVNAAPAGSTVTLAGAAVTISSTVTIDKKLHLTGPGSITETTILAPMISITSTGDGSTAEGITFVGIETLGDFPGDSTALLRSAVVATSADDVRIDRVRISAKSSGVRFVSCNRATVERSSFVGVLTASTAGANNSSAFSVSGGEGSRILHVSARDCGSAALVQSDAERVVIDGVEGSGFWDNGVYVSSGFACTVSRVVIDGVSNPSGFAIKARGSFHVIAENVLRNSAGGGISVTGNGATPDALGANGSGTIVANNAIEGTTSYGILIGTQDGYFPRDFRATNNYLKDIASAGGDAGAIVIGGNGHRVTDNTIDGFAGQYGIIASTAAAAEYTRLSIARNDIRGATHATPEGIRATFVDDSSIEGNRIDATTLPTNSIRIRTSDNLTVDGNTAASIRWEIGHASTGGSCKNNRAADITGDLAGVTIASTIGDDTFDAVTIGGKTGLVTLTWTATVNTDASLGDVFLIPASSASAITIAPPTVPTTGKRITYVVKNTSGGALGVFTWNAVFKMATWTAPATGFSRSITFMYDGTNWIEQYRATADVPN
jgi:hypothetical protein